jgi:uncharacterized membrane protein YdjX (TVP38/TMEM64 family)
MLSRGKKIMVTVVLAALVAAALFATNMGQSITLSNIQQKAENLQDIVDKYYITSILIFIASYILMNLILPTASIFTLLAGFLFGTAPAVAYTLTAAVFGAAAGFWLSRIFAGHWLQYKWQNQLSGFNEKFDKYGYVYLILIRMIPMMPYALINFIAGLTRAKTSIFMATTAIGSLPGILVFSYAGRHLLSIKSVEDVLTGKVLLAFLFMTIFIGSVTLLKAAMDKKNGQTY